jgi:hypothetical protein
MRFCRRPVDYDGLSPTYAALGSHYYSRSVHEKSVDSLTESLKFATRFGDRRREAQTPGDDPARRSQPAGLRRRPSINGG